MISKTLHIVLSSNERYMPGATVALAGIALNAKPETALHFHVFTEQVKQESFAFLEATIKRLHPKSVVEQHVCNEVLLNGLPLWAGSRMSAVRIFFPRLLPQVTWALYVDCDVLYLASPEEHFAAADDSVYACVSKEMSSSAPAEELRWAKAHSLALDVENYFNAGVMLLNLKKMRADGVPEMLGNFFERHKDIQYPDQTAMNYCFGYRGKKIIGQHYNYLQIFLDDAALCTRPVIHYVSGIPWLPKIAVVANGRFKLWHAFADKYVWQKKGESYRRCFARRMLFLKKLEYVLMVTPVLSQLFFVALSLIGKGKYYARWKKVMTEYDVTKAGIRGLLDWLVVSG